MTGVLGRGVEMTGMGARRGCGGDVGMGVGVGGDGRHSQPVPVIEFSGASGSKTGGIPTKRGDTEVGMAMSAQRRERVVLKRIWLAHIRILHLRVSVHIFVRHIMCTNQICCL
jgi:hypothetical protein